MLSDLKNGKRVSDLEFDSIYQSQFRIPSSRHWTPVEVAVTAAKLLAEDSTARILDVGSGVGKFCHIGALVTPGRFVGVEQRGALVAEAQGIASAKSIKRASFIQGDAFEIDWCTYSGIYMYNPFYENIDLEKPIDVFQTPDRDVYLSAIRKVEDNLETMPIGTKAVTYHGFGGVFPGTYEPYFSRQCGRGFIRAWVKTK